MNDHDRAGELLRRLGWQGEQGDTRAAFIYQCLQVGMRELVIEHRFERVMKDPTALATRTGRRGLLYRVSRSDLKRLEADMHENAKSIEGSDEPKFLEQEVVAAVVRMTAPPRLDVSMIEMAEAHLGAEISRFYADESGESKNQG